jgi:hypothetical protein
MCGSGLMGNLMKSAVAAHLRDGHFVIRVDGRVKSHHRHFLDALREGLQLRDQFPQHDVKVQAMKVVGYERTAWPAPGSADTELGVLMEPEVSYGAAEVYTRVQA